MFYRSGWLRCVGLKFAGDRVVKGIGIDRVKGSGLLTLGVIYCCIIYYTYTYIHILYYYILLYIILHTYVYYY